nr:hypothetical protein BaRGS_020799 [Batillaria attramentaria]
MAQRLNAFEAKINAQQAQIAAQQAQIDSLERVVAFQAYGGQNPVSALAHGTIIASHVTLNIGNAYDPKSGFFTTPVSGLYQFHASFLDHDHADGVWAGIFVENTQVAYGISDTRTGYWDTTLIAATVHVTQGQVVQLRNDKNAVVDLFGGHYLWFSGFLIQAD